MKRLTTWQRIALLLFCLLLILSQVACLGLAGASDCGYSQGDAVCTSVAVPKLKATERAYREANE